MPPSQELKTSPHHFKLVCMTHQSRESQVLSSTSIALRIIFEWPWSNFIVTRLLPDPHRPCLRQGSTRSLETTIVPSRRLRRKVRSLLRFPIPCMHGVRWGCVIELENQPLVWILIDLIFKFVRRPSHREWRQKKERKAKSETHGRLSGPIGRTGVAPRPRFLCQIQSRETLIALKQQVQIQCRIPCSCRMTIV